MKALRTRRTGCHVAGQWWVGGARATPSLGRARGRGGRGGSTEEGNAVAARGVCILVAAVGCAGSGAGLAAELRGASVVGADVNGSARVGRSVGFAVDGGVSSALGGGVAPVRAGSWVGASVSTLVGGLVD